MLVTKTTVWQKEKVILNKDSAHWQNVQHHFGNVGGKNVVGDFSGGDVSDLGGLIELVPLIQKNGIFSEFAAQVEEWRQGPVKYSIEHLLLQRVGLIVAGYEDGNDSNFKRHDKALGTFLHMLTGNESVASQGTISILEGSITRATNFGLECWFIESYIEGLKQRLKKKKRKTVVLDFDGASSPVRGSQQGSAYHGYYEVTMYRPLFVNDDGGNLVIPLLRPGNASELWLTLPLIERLVAALRKAIPGLVITIRCDAGFNDPKIYDWCEDNGVFYIMRLSGTGDNGGLWVSSKMVVEAVEKRFRKRHKAPRYLHSRIAKSKLEAGIKKLEQGRRKEKLAELETRVERIFTEFLHQAGKGGKDKFNWRRKRRVLCVATYTDWGAKKAFFVTNITDSNCDQLVHGLYNKRGNMERNIEELKSLDCTRLSCQEFESNQFRLFLHGLAYRLLTSVRDLLPNSIQHWSMNSIRKHLILLPVLLKETARQIAFHWTSTCEWKKEFHLLFRAIDRLPPLRG